MAKNFRVVVREEPQSHNSIRGRGASWSPANRFEKLHVDLTDLDVVDVDLETEERPRRERQYLRDDTKSVITHHKEPSCYTRHGSFGQSRDAQCSGCKYFSNVAGLEFAASARAADLVTTSPSRCDPATSQCRNSNRRDGCTDHPGAHRS